MLTYCIIFYCIMWLKRWWNVLAVVCCCREFVMGSAVEDMQVGCLWQGDYLITVSLSGFINYLDKSSGRLARIVKVCFHVLLHCNWRFPHSGVYVTVERLSIHLSVSSITAAVVCSTFAAEYAAGWRCQWRAAAWNCLSSEDFILFFVSDICELCWNFYAAYTIFSN